MNTTEIKQLLAEADKVSQVPLIESLHGIGKSTICAQYAKDNDLHFEPIILSLYDIGDLLGMPKTAVIGGMESTEWAAPDWFSRIVTAAWPETMKVSDLSFTDKKLEKAVQDSNMETISRGELNTLLCETHNLPHGLHLLRQSSVSYAHSKRSVILLDEMNRAQVDVLNASLQLILEKRLHSHLLPVVNGQDTFIVAAINPADQEYTVNSFDPALLDRFICCSLESNASEWLSWARTNNIHKSITSFIADNPTKLHFTPKVGKGASNRSWARLSEYMHSIKGTFTDTSIHYINGTLGQQIGAEFFIFLQNFEESLSVEDVETIVSKTPKSTNAVYLSKRLSKRVEQQEAIKRIDLAHNLQDKYLSETDYKKAMPYLAYLHALPIESLTTYLLDVKTNSFEEYKHLAELDDDATNKKLFYKTLVKR